MVVKGSEHSFGAVGHVCGVKGDADGEIFPGKPGFRGKGEVGPATGLCVVGGTVNQGGQPLSDRLQCRAGTCDDKPSSGVVQGDGRASACVDGWIDLFEGLVHPSLIDAGDGGHRLALAIAVGPGVGHVEPLPGEP